MTSKKFHSRDSSSHSHDEKIVRVASFMTCHIGFQETLFSYFVYNTMSPTYYDNSSWPSRNILCARIFFFSSNVFSIHLKLVVQLKQQVYSAMHGMNCYNTAD